MAVRTLVDGLWHGSRAYDSTPDEAKPIDLVLERSEWDIAGSGTDQDGAFSLKGTVSESNEVDLDLRYEGSDRVVELIGSFSPRTGRISGRWRVQGRRHGSFELVPGKRRAARVAKERPLAPPLALPDDTARVEALLARAVGKGGIDYTVGAGYIAAHGALKTFATRRGFVPARALEAPMNELLLAREKLADTLQCPLPSVMQAAAGEHAREVVLRAEEVLRAIAEMTPVRLDLDAASRTELAQLLGTWFAELRVETDRPRRALHITGKLAALLEAVNADLGPGS